MKNKKTLKLLILSIILFYVINIYAMNYNSDFYVNPVPILFIGYLLYMIFDLLL